MYEYIYMSLCKCMFECMFQSRGCLRIVDGLEVKGLSQITPQRETLDLMGEWWFNAVSATEAIFMARTLYNQGVLVPQE